MPGIFKIKNLQDAEFTLTHPDGVGAVSINSNDIAKSDVVNAALALKANTADLKELGVGQTWQDVTASRILGTTYTNSTGKPIMVAVTCISSANHIRIQVDSIQYASREQLGASCIVPNGSTYVVTSDGSKEYWRELR